MKRMDYRRVEERATEVVTDWLIDKRPKIGEKVWDGSQGDPKELRELVDEEIGEGAKWAEPAAEYVYFALQDLVPSGNGLVHIDWGRLAEALREVFQMEPNGTNQNKKRRSR